MQIMTICYIFNTYLNNNPEKSDGTTLKLPFM